MSTHTDLHKGLHSEQGARSGEHRGRSPTRSSRSATSPGWSSRSRTLPAPKRSPPRSASATVTRTADELQLRGTDPGSPCVLIRRGPRSRFAGLAFAAQDKADLERLATADRRANPRASRLDRRPRRRPDRPGRVPGAGGRRHASSCPPLPAQHAADVQLRPRLRPRQLDAAAAARARPRSAAGPCRAAEQRLRRVAGLVPRSFRADRQRLPLLPRPARPRPDDELHPLRPRQRLRPTITPWPWPWARPTVTCTRPIRCATSTPSPPAGSTCASRATAGRGESAGTSRAARLFDYWRDPDGFLVEHFADGDMFDSTLEPGWAPFTASGLAQWGPPVTKDFLGLAPGREARARASVDAGRGA